jgi:hypothetical protein
MDAGWKKVRSGVEVVELLGLDGVGELTLEQLLLAPESAGYIRVEDGIEELPPGQYGLLLPSTRYFFNVSACRELRGDVMVALATFFMTHSAPTSAAVAAFRKVHANIKRLSPEELELVRAIIRACPGNPYKQPVAEADVLSEFGGPSETVDDLLDSLQSQGVISARRGGRIKLTY